MTINVHAVAAPFRPPRVSRDEARALARAAAALDGQARVAEALSPALGETIALGGPPRISREGGRDCVRVRVARGATEASAWIDAALALEAVGRLLPRAEVAAPRPLTEAERGAVAYLALAALRALGDGWRLVDVTDAPAPAGVAEVDARAFGLTWGVRLDLPAGASGAPAWPLLDAAPQEVAIVVGAARLAGADVASLGAGDVIVPDRLADVRRGGEVALACGRLRADAVIDGDRLRVSSPWTPHGGTKMDDARAALAAGLEVELVAEAGRIRMTGREVLDLRPGAVIELARKVGDPIDLTSGGRVVARAELCDLEGDLGLRVVEILPAG